MSIKKSFLIISLFLALGTTAEANQDTLTVNYPPDKTIMEFGVLGISLTVPQGYADLINIIINDKQEMKIVPDSRFECLSMLLRVGINRINIVAIKDNSEINRIAMSVFRRSDLESAYKDPPSGFQKDYFHMKSHEECAACHVLKPADADRKPINVAAFPDEKSKISMISAAAASTCYSCHKALTSFPFVHGPSAVWSCLSCHEPQTEPVYSVKKPDTKVCFGCHIERKEEWYGKKYFHGPFTIGNCIICHSPHASENPFNLHKPTWDLCTNCHVNEGSGRHIVEAVFGAYFHPTRGKPDPLRKGMELSCASCHNPHASDAPKLWRLNVGSGFELCRKCHTD